eukprot:COSAG01_NODE_8329_length_2827_cov_3.769428_4_plen_110_part_00
METACSHQRLLHPPHRRRVAAAARVQLALALALLLLPPPPPCEGATGLQPGAQQGEQQRRRGGSCAPALGAALALGATRRTLGEARAEGVVAYPRPLRPQYFVTRIVVA